MNVAQANATPDVLRLLIAGGGRPRLAMRGTSMLPLLREGMILELTAFDRTSARVGDVIVFVQDARLVAHRIIGFGPSDVQTCGDAHPWAPERVVAEAIVGAVAAVYATADPSAARVDDERYRARAARVVRTRPLRASRGRTMAALARTADALPWRRAHRFAALRDVLGAYVRGEPAAIAPAVANTDLAALAEYARWHGCATLLQAALATSPSPRFISVGHALQRHGRRYAVRAIAIRVQIVDVVGTLRAANVPFALLKGAARLYAADDALFYATNDLDVLVPPEALDAAIAALRARGYAFLASQHEQRAYRKRHHHAAPLYPPKGGGVAVELHVALARPHWLSTPTDWHALAPHLIRANGAGGEALVLDTFGSFLHHAVHGIGNTRYRDVVTCAKMFSALDSEAREQLAAIVRAERIDPVRLEASFVMATQLAGFVQPNVRRAVAAYVRWVAAREDLPRLLARRTQLLEAWYASGGRPTPLAFRLLAQHVSLRRFVGRLALVPVIAAYVAWRR